ncbi:MAG: hypothetical protein P8O79_03420 [Halieaceae bacterium]|nr:hypothetical protein [Halieaceae bacterium]
MAQLIILHHAALDAFLGGHAPPNSALLILCDPSDLDVRQLGILSQCSSKVYWLCSEAQTIPFGQHADYDKWAELSVQCTRSFFWPA